VLDATVRFVVMPLAGRATAVALAVAGMLGGMVASASAAERPETIPALQRWAPASGGETFRLRADARIVLRHRDRNAWGDEARRLARDLGRLLGRPVATTSRRGAGARAGDVVLRRAARRPRLGSEGYELRIGRTFTIVAPRSAGAFYGGRTLLQLVRSGDPIPRGRARDWPRYPERGLMVDVGRQYFTPGWIEARIRQLGYLKLNYLHLHLSDNQGFRVQSDTHREIVSDEHLTKREIRRILEVARHHHVTVVPEIDMPGHMEAALAPHPELQLRNAAGEAATSVLDVTNPAARQFARDLIEEYMGLFGGPYWHTGGDEVLPSAAYSRYPSLESYAKERYGPSANAKDAIHGFVNWVDRIVRRHGKTTRMWHDEMNGGSAVTRDPRIVAEWWTDLSPLSDAQPPTPLELLDRGHAIMNAGWFPTYYVNGVGGSNTLVRPDLARAYEEWEVHEFQGLAGADDPPDLVSPDEPENLGSKLHVWNDNPGLVSESETTNAIHHALRVHAQKTWQSPQLAPTYAEFLPIIDAVGDAP
jgi:hexosaminidase